MAGLDFACGLVTLRDLENDLKQLTNAVKKYDQVPPDIANRSGDTVLRFAAAHNLVQEIQDLLDTGDQSVLAYDEWGLSPMTLAVFEGHVDVVHLFTSSIDNMNLLCSVKLGSQIGCPLHLAAILGHVSVVRCLLSAGVSCDLPNTEGFTPLSLAAYAGHLDVVSVLGNSGANVNSVSSTKLTPLHSATMQDHVPTALYLIENGAKVNKLDNRGNIPLHYAVKMKSNQLIGSLIAAGSLKNQFNKSLETPLHIAIRTGHLSTIKQLVSLGCDVNLAKPDGSGAPLSLLVSIYSENTWSDEFRAILNVLLRGKCLLNIEAFCTLESPVYSAINMGKSDVAESLLIHGADPNLSSPFDITALQACCKNGDEHILNLLLHCGIDWSRERWLKMYAGMTSDYKVRSLIQLVKSWQCSPVSLQNLCRITIRRQLKELLLSKLDRLQVPLTLKKFLLFSDICKHPLGDFGRCMFDECDSHSVILPSTADGDLESCDNGSRTKPSAGDLASGSTSSYSVDM